MWTGRAIGATAVCQRARTSSAVKPSGARAIRPAGTSRAAWWPSSQSWPPTWSGPVTPAVSGAETSQTVMQRVTAASHVAKAASAACAAARPARRRSRPWGLSQTSANVAPQSAASSRNASPSAGTSGSCRARAAASCSATQLRSGPASTALRGSLSSRIPPLWPAHPFPQGRRGAPHRGCGGDSPRRRNRRLQGGAAPPRREKPRAPAAHPRGRGPWPETLTTPA